ncbi:MAG: endonuclease [Rhodobacterales bacterium]|nr:MAG: endonuclease [Rhodobacterales bacterium]
MRLATYNVEWFHRLFDDAGHILDDGAWSSRRDVTRAQQLHALARVFRAMDADGVMIIEAPDAHARRDGIAALENFAARFDLRARKAVMGFVNETQQEIAFLYDPDVMSAQHDPRDAGAPRFDETFRLDLDTDDFPDPVRWSKPPLELEVQVKGGPRLRLIGVHAKSKAPHGATDPDAILRLSIENRRKQLAQCIWLRERVEAHLTAGDSVIVLGDFNDGPGLDEFEQLFGRSSVEVVLGEVGPTGLHDPHARQVLAQRIGVSPSTARFYFAPEHRYMEAMLDYIMLSPDLMARDPKWRIWHPFDDPECFHDRGMQQALLTASDHFPVTVDL